ncbi:hypothetical protein JHK82_040362 [Glycine max]|nr:hypothetical protein JHK82_040362 [Glycine max]
MFPKEIICGVGAGIGLLDFLRNNLQKHNPLSFTCDIFDQPEQDMPHSINVTPAEQHAIKRRYM